MKYLLFIFIISSCKTNKIVPDVNYITDTEIEDIEIKNTDIRNKNDNIFNDSSYLQYQNFKNSINQK